MDNLWIWLVVEPNFSEKSEFVNSDDEIPNILKNEENVTNLQPEQYVIDLVDNLGKSWETMVNNGDEW